MANAYSSPERTAAYMEHLDKNAERISYLRRAMSDQDSDMATCVLAFTELYHLLDGDPLAQRRLVVNLEFAAKRHQTPTQH